MRKLIILLSISFTAIASNFEDFKVEDIAKLKKEFFKTKMDQEERSMKCLEYADELSVYHKYDDAIEFYNCSIKSNTNEVKLASFYGLVFANDQLGEREEAKKIAKKGLQFIKDAEFHKTYGATFNYILGMNLDKYSNEQLLEIYDSPFYSQALIMSIGQWALEGLVTRAYKNIQRYNVSEDSSIPMKLHYDIVALAYHEKKGQKLSKLLCNSINEITGREKHSVAGRMCLALNDHLKGNKVNLKNLAELNQFMKALFPRDYWNYLLINKIVNK